MAAIVISSETQIVKYPVRCTLLITNTYIVFNCKVSFSTASWDEEGLVPRQGGLVTFILCKVLLSTLCKIFSSLSS